VSTEKRPNGIIDGINYGTDPTKVALCLWAPLKTSVYAVGDFSNWKILPENLMKKDGEHFWIELAGLTPSQEYAFQYLVDETLYVADPYADKILDPDDQFIPSEIYPELKSYPAGAVREQSYFNRAAIIQTGQVAYEWQTTDFEKPKKEELVIYELLVRDLFSQDERNYQNLIDTLSYFKRLGINTIELMPITEFNGNESWGYNPTFMFAPDKAYGTKNKLKEFIDKCHAEGIAVILDVVMNQQDLPNPYVLMYYDFTSNKPAANSPWFNQEATHPFNVFFDLNHESTYTQQYLDTVNYYWINEYKFDGYRFDLSKGFTQKNAGGSVSEWGKYDASRIAILKRMADKIWEHSPEAYVILEHFADNTEEKELAEHRSGEGKGMMLWGNYNNAYSQNAQGNSGTDFSPIYHANRNWSVPHVVGYMESHDEDRLMYRNLQSGKSSGSYDIKSLATALDRIKAASLMFYTVPGPKMLWQFGELGYDQSINRCEDGSVSESCRVSPKPVHWDYRSDSQRYALYSHVSELLGLRSTYDVFRTGTATIPSGSSLIKRIGLKNSPYTATPAGPEEMNVQLVANFDVVAKESAISFAHTGVWYEYYSEQFLSVTSTSQILSLAPGEYRMYTDYPLKGEPITGAEETPSHRFTIYPNPVQDDFTVEDINIKNVKLYTPEGKELPLKKRSDSIWSTHGVAPGFYIVQIETKQGIRQSKIIKQ
jgi:1,4-alpha-glucan branching enzyme